MTTHNPELRMCTLVGCNRPNHYENCPECFGWGFTDTGGILSAWAAELCWRAGGPFKKCTSCGGTPSGVSDGT